MPGHFDQLLREYKHILIGPFMIQNAFVVPPNQRPYAWGADDWADLWQDLVDTIRESEERTTDPFYAYHFLGPMFFQKGADSEDLKILDGQQRLASIEVLFAVVNDIIRYFQFTGRMSNQGVNLPGRINDYTQAIGTVPPQLRLTLGKRNRSFFEKLLEPVQFTPTSRGAVFFKPSALREESKQDASNESLLRCYRFFLLEIAKYLARRYGTEWRRGRPDPERITNILVQNAPNTEQFLNQIVTNLTERFYVLTAIVPSPEIMYQMFETLNQRGEKLLVADLFKNLLFDRFERRVGEGRVEFLWGGLESAVGEDYMTDFLRHYWLSDFRFVRTNELFREIREEISRIEGNREFETFMQKMTTEGGIYKGLRTPNDPRWMNIRGAEQLLDEVSHLGFKQGLPLLLAAFAIHGNTEPTRFFELLKAYLNLVVRSYTILRENPNEYEVDYSNWALAIRHRTETVEQVITRIRDATPSDDDIRAGIVGMNGVSPRVGHYIITKINDGLQNPLNRAWDNNPTVEHIIPRNPEEWWNEFLESRRLKAKSLVERLGNLTILSAEDNEELGNLPYPEKRRRYLATGAPINIRTFTAAEFDEFTADAIERREEIMASLIVDLHLWS